MFLIDILDGINVLEGKMVKFNKRFGWNKRLSRIILNKLENYQAPSVSQVFQLKGYFPKLIVPGGSWSSV
jgi:hypothetical protein